ncbi:MAG: hypothetical protein D0530_04880 [Methylococcales bacterium]|nr:MAG: hypothetical protein D0530_04880 [Methylococcales bacterium]
MGVGLKSLYLTTYLTGKKLYRTVSADDVVTTGPLSSVAVLDLTVDSGKMIQNSGTITYGTNMRGSNAYLALYVSPTSGTPTIQLWAFGGDDAQVAPQKYLPYGAAVSIPATGSVVVFKDIPANMYKVTVSGTSGSAVALVEQHSE